MKTKQLIIMALILCMSAFCMTAFAGGDESENLVVNSAWADSEMIHIEVENKETGKTSKMELNLKDYTTDSEYLSIQAVDFEGNKSNVVEIINPNYIPKKESESGVPNGNAFTPDGTGTVTDNANSGDGKEFYTIKTADENVYYLVIDKERNADNVYFLNAVTENDLLSLAKKGDGKSSSAIPTVEKEEPTPTPAPEQEEKKSESKENSNGAMIFIVIALIAAGGAGYYFKIYKPKNQPSEPDDTDYEDEEDYDDYDYEDETEESDDYEDLETDDADTEGDEE